MTQDFNDSELEAYLDESLNPERAGQLEQALRKDKALLQRLSAINGRRDSGVHSLGEIWRRHQVGVPSPDKIRDFLSDRLSTEESDYIRFRIKTLKCRFTIALIDDVQQQQAEPDSRSTSRRKKYFQKSADLLPGKRGNRL